MKTMYLKNGHLGFQLAAMNTASCTRRSQVKTNVAGDEGMRHGRIQKPETLFARDECETVYEHRVDRFRDHYRRFDINDGKTIKAHQY